MIPEGWETYKLGEVAELRKEQVIPIGEEQPYIGLEHIEQQTLRLNDIGSSKEVISNKYKFYYGDILYGKLRPYFRKVYQPKFEGVCSTDIYVIKNKKTIDRTLLFYLIASEEFTKIANSGSSGTKMPRADWNQLLKSEWTIPNSLDEQKKLASILSSLDDKIELNLQMNKTLEAIAQTIFKEWFVDFQFPGFYGELVDGLPKGWRKGKIGDIADVIDCLHSKKPERVQTNTGRILLQLNNILDNGLLDLTEKFYISEQDYSNWISRIEVSEGDCVITNVGRVGSVARIPEDINAALGRNMTGIRPKKDYPFSTFIIQLLISDFMRSEIEKKKDFGTILDALNVKNIPKLSFALPNVELISNFERIVSPMRTRMEYNVKENLTLSSIRDNLLPKLMTGKIRVA